LIRTKIPAILVNKGFIYWKQLAIVHAL